MVGFEACEVMANNNESNAEEQENELSVLESIFSGEDDSFIWNKQALIQAFNATNGGPSLCGGESPESHSPGSSQELWCGKISVDLEEELKQPLRVYLAANNTERHSNKPDRECLLNRLPSLTLVFCLPAGYPSHSPPDFALSAVWLDCDTNSFLRNLLLQYWSENQGLPVLYSWIEMLRDGTPTHLPTSTDLDKVCQSRPAAERSTSTSSCGGKPKIRHASGGGGAIATASSAVKRRKNSSSAVNSPGANNAVSSSSRRKSRDSIATATPPALITVDEYLRQESTISYTAHQRFAMLEDYEAVWMRRKFDRAWHSCLVCCEEYKGSDCMLFTLCGHIFCLACVKDYFSMLIKEGRVTSVGCLANDCSSPVSPDQVCRIVGGGDIYERYDRLLLAQTLDLMSDVVSCPRADCQQPVLLDEALGSETSMSSNRIASCASCRFAFCVFCRKGYHGLAPCAYTSAARSRIVDEYCGGDAETRTRLEKRFGAIHVKRLVDEFQAEQWKDENSKQCPKCRSNIEKSHGCNKVHCTKCDTSFCWLCNMVLSNDPYKHFNSPGNSSCYGLLFLPGDDSSDASSDDDDEGWWQGNE